MSRYSEYSANQSLRNEAARVSLATAPAIAFLPCTATVREKAGSKATARHMVRDARRTVPTIPHNSPVWLVVYTLACPVVFGTVALVASLVG